LDLFSKMLLYKFGNPSWTHDIKIDL
jgi:hypothetical protein